MHFDLSFPLDCVHNVADEEDDLEDECCPEQDWVAQQVHPVVFARENLPLEPTMIAFIQYHFLLSS